MSKKWNWSDHHHVEVHLLCDGMGTRAQPFRLALVSRLHVETTNIVFVSVSTKSDAFLLVRSTCPVCYSHLMRFVIYRFRIQRRPGQL